MPSFVQLFVLTCVLALGWIGTGIGQDTPPLMQDGVAEPSFKGISRPVDLLTARHYGGLRQFAQGRLLEGKSRWLEALQTYQLVLQQEPAAVEIMRMCVPLCLKLERTVEALHYLREALALEPRQPELWLRYAHLLYELDRHEEVVAVSRQAQQIFTGNQFPALQAECLILQAMGQEELERYADAAQAYEKALRLLEDRDGYLEDALAPAAEELPRQQARVLERIARVGVKLQRFEAALAAYREADALSPAEPARLDLNLAETYLAMHQPEKALAHVARCLAGKPENSEPYRLLAAGLKLAGRGEETVSTLETLLRSQAGNLGLSLVLAEEYQACRRSADAERIYRQMRDASPLMNREVLTGLYLSLAQQGRWREMVTELDYCCRQPQQAAQARGILAVLLEQPTLLQGVLKEAENMDVGPVAGLLLVRVALQRGAWQAAEHLAAKQTSPKSRPTEAYLLWCRALVEQEKYQELAEVCRRALRDDAVTGPLTFQLELAKALARTHDALGAEEAIRSARAWTAPGSMDDHKTSCTYLYVLHLLGKHQECLQEAERLERKLAKSPWVRQVRYAAAQAAEALEQFATAREYLTAIVRQDANDAEAAAALARVLFLERKDLPDAEKWIRLAVELDDVERRRRLRLEGSKSRVEPNLSYRAILVLVLMQRGRMQEARDLWATAAWQSSQNAWVLLCGGDLLAQGGDLSAARQAWQRAAGLAKEHPGLGLNLNPALQTRLQSDEAGIRQISAGGLAPSFSSPTRP
jgi:tetratricopeptide (TPR) repeat protein